MTTTTTERMSRLLEIVENHNDKLPEQDYLEICNILRDIHQTQPSGSNENYQRRYYDLLELSNSLRSQADRWFQKWEETSNSLMEEKINNLNLMQSYKDANEIISKLQKKNEQLKAELKLLRKDKKKFTIDEKREMIIEFLEQKDRFESIKMFQKQSSKECKEYISRCYLDTGITRLFNKIFNVKK